MFLVYHSNWMTFLILRFYMKNKDTLYLSVCIDKAQIRYHIEGSKSLYPSLRQPELLLFIRNKLFLLPNHDRTTARGSVRGSSSEVSHTLMGLRLYFYHFWFRGRMWECFVQEYWGHASSFHYSLNGGFKK